LNYLPRKIFEPPEAGTAVVLVGVLVVAAPVGMLADVVLAAAAPVGMPVAVAVVGTTVQAADRIAAAEVAVVQG